MSSSERIANRIVSATPEPTIDEVGEFWVVTFPNNASEIEDIIMRRTVAGMSLQFKGGLNVADIAGIFHTDVRATKFAKALLLLRDGGKPSS